jgi:hypothetical protein
MMIREPPSAMGESRVVKASRFAVTPAFDLNVVSCWSGQKIAISKLLEPTTNEFQLYKENLPSNNSAILLGAYLEVSQPATSNCPIRSVGRKLWQSGTNIR